MRKLSAADRSLIWQVSMQYLGMPFSLYGDGASTFNCRQLVAKVYQVALNINLPKKVDWLFLTSRIIKTADLQVGDLVFYCREPRPRRRLATHVAIYIGEGEIINARQKAGKVLIEEIHAPLKNHILLESKDETICNLWLSEVLSI